MQIRAILADDEPLARKYLRSILEEIPDVSVIGEASNGDESLKLSQNLRPDVLFLDIRMPGLSGMEVAKKLSQEKEPPYIVFVTGFDEYAVSAFEASATDYILKPFEEDRVKQTIQRVKKGLVNKGLVERAMESAAEEPQHKEFSVERLPIRADGIIRLLDPNQIHYIRCENKKVLIRTGSHEYKTNFTLTQLENKLSPKQFFRANEGCLVNMEKVREINYLGDESYELVLSDKEETLIPLSRSRAKLLKKLIGW